MPTNQAKTILITGASSGIGKATAVYLAERGYHVIGTSRSAARLEDLQKEASKRNLAIAAIELDINSDDDVDAVVPSLIERLGPIDVLVNNAGYGLWGPVENLSIDELKAQFEANFFGAVRLIKAVLPEMIGRRSGTIINISSVEGRLATPFNGAYAASKFALEGLSEALRSEVWPFGVRVSAVEPGLFRTDFQKNQVVGREVQAKDSPYSPYIEKYNSRHDTFKKMATDPIKVAKVIHKIVRSRSPTLRYPVGLEARLGMLGARLIPERLFQAMVRRATVK